jgi:hypothetical protein
MTENIQELLVHEETALLIGGGHRTALAAAIMELANNEALRKKAWARRPRADSFSGGHMASKCYDGVGATSGKPHSKIEK